MKVTSPAKLSQAIDEAIKFGFRKRFIFHKGKIYSLQSNRNYNLSEFAVVQSYPIILSNGDLGEIHYIVLNNSQLGFYLNEAENRTVPQENNRKDFENINNLLKNNYST